MRATFVFVVLLLVSANAIPLVSVGGSTHLSGKKIALDPGHGGTDPGASGLGLVEKEVNLDVAVRLRDLLVKEGATVFMTRTTDATVSLADRVAVANGNNVDRYVSIHANSCGGCGGHGTETYYHSSLPATSTSANLASKAQAEIVKLLGTRDRGLKTADFYVLRTTSMPAIHVELGFVDHAGDNALLAAPAKRQDFARAILFGIQAHFGVTPHDPTDPAPPPGDTTPPSISITSPDLRDWFRAVVTTHADIVDAGGVASAKARVGAGAWVNDNSAPYQWSWDTRTLRDGAHDFSIEAADAAGNVGRESAKLNVDNTPPAITVTTDLGAWRRGTVTVTADIDDLSGVVTAKARAGAGPWRGAAAPYAWVYDTTSLSDGVHDLAFEATDKAGNVATAADKLRVDNTPPTISVLSPDLSGWLRGDLNLAAAIADATSGVASAKARIDDGDWTVASAPHEWTWDTATLADGEHELRLQATDRAGNVAERVYRLRVDNTAPEITLVAPRAGDVFAGPVLLKVGRTEFAVVAGTVTVTADAFDATSGVAEVAFLLDDEEHRIDRIPSYSWDWDTTKVVEPGMHRLSVRATDRAGNVAEDEVGVLVVVALGKVKLPL